MAEQEKRQESSAQQAANAASNARTTFRVVRTVASVARGAAAFFANPASLAIIVPVLIMILALVFATGFTGGPGGSRPGSQSGDTIAACEFTRDSLRTNPPPVRGTVKSSILAGWIATAGNLSSVPPAILAGVATVENANFTLNANDERDAIKNNYYYIVSQANQGINKETNAIGLMQVSTGRTLVVATGRILDHCESLITRGFLANAAQKLGKKIHDEAGDGGLSYYCVADTEERIKRLCQTTSTIKNSPIYTPDGPLDDTYLNLCRLQDNLMVATEKLKADLGSGSWDIESDLTRVIGNYYGDCYYGSGNYCDEVLAGYKSCTQTQFAKAGMNSTIIPAGAGGARIASVAKQIAEQVIHSANPGMAGCDVGGTYGASAHCWSEMRSYDQAGDPNYLQCTEFVWAVFDKAGFGAQINEIRAGNAGEWPARASNSKSFDVFTDPNRLAPGDIISIGQGGYVAHVGVVINRKRNVVTIAQSATEYAIEDYFIENGQLVVPSAGPSGARKGNIGFIRLKEQQQ